MVTSEKKLREFEPYSVAAEELKRTALAPLLAAKEYNHSMRLIQLLWDDPPVIAELESVKAFTKFWGAMVKGLSLAFLSATRTHAVQTGLLLRNALEHSVLAGYSLSVESHEIFGQKKFQKVRGRAYNWIEKNYAEDSSLIKAMKDSLSEVEVHANVYNASMNYLAEKGGWKMLFFDNQEPLSLRQYFWYVSHVTCSAIVFVDKVAQQESSNGRFSRDFLNKFESLKVESRALGDELAEETVKSEEGMQTLFTSTL